jgi:DNA mismatch repair protein MSH5
VLISFRAQVYFKTSEMREMDDHFGDVYGIISDREIEISHELAQYVLQFEQLLTTCSDVCGELDRFGYQLVQTFSVLMFTVAY